jgi:hypothetical protein
VAQAAIDRIIERTQSGQDADGNRFEPYTEAYAKKKGVSRNAVDMTLFGDMLENLEIIDETPQTVTLGFSDSLQNAKAFNHITGDTVTPRNFLGAVKKEGKLYQLSDEDREAVISQVEDQITGESEADGDIPPQAERIFERILAGDFDEDIGL